MGSNQYISKHTKAINDIKQGVKDWVKTIRQGLTGLVDYLLPGVGRKIESDLAKINPDLKWKTQQDALSWINGKLNQYSNDIEAKNRILAKLQDQLNAVKSDVSTARNYKVQAPHQLRKDLEDQVEKATKDLVNMNTKLNNAYIAQSAAANSPDWSQNLAENFEKLASQIDKESEE